MCPNNTDAPALKLWTQTANTWKTQIARAISDADSDGRTDRQG